MEREPVEPAFEPAPAAQQLAVAPAAAVLTGAAFTPAGMLAIQQAAGNRAAGALLARRRLARETTNIEDKFRENRRAVDDKATAKAKEWVAADREGLSMWTVEAQRLFWYLVKEYAPAYFDPPRMSSNYVGLKRQPTFELVKERTWDPKKGSQETGKWMIVLGPSFVRRIAGGELGNVVKELRAVLRGLDEKVLDGSKETAVQIGDEQVAVSDKAQRDDAERIVRHLSDEYGIDLNSVRALEAMRIKHPALGAEQEAAAAGVVRTPWKYRDLVGLERAAAHYAPILGARRAGSARKDDQQEVTSVGKLTHSLAKGRVDTDTLGEQFPAHQCAVLFTHGSDSSLNWGSDKTREIEGTFTHELAHGLLKFAQDDFQKKIGYWRDFGEQSGTRGAEAPPTKYGDWNVAEDLAETAMLFFVDRPRLVRGDGTTAAGKPGNPCPKRDAYMAKLVQTWSIQPAAAPRARAHR